LPSWLKLFMLSNTLQVAVKSHLVWIVGLRTGYEVHALQIAGPLAFRVVMDTSAATHCDHSPHKAQSQSSAQLPVIFSSVGEVEVRANDFKCFCFKVLEHIKEDKLLNLSAGESEYVKDVIRIALNWINSSLPMDANDIDDELKQLTSKVNPIVSRLLDNTSLRRSATPIAESWLDDNQRWTEFFDLTTNKKWWAHDDGRWGFYSSPHSFNVILGNAEVLGESVHSLPARLLQTPPSVPHLTKAHSHLWGELNKLALEHKALRDAYDSLREDVEDARNTIAEVSQRIIQLESAMLQIQGLQQPQPPPSVPSVAAMVERPLLMKAPQPGCEQPVSRPSATSVAAAAAQPLLRKAPPLGCLQPVRWPNGPSGIVATERPKLIKAPPLGSSQPVRRPSAPSVTATAEQPLLMKAPPPGCEQPVK
jgi:hypothetical protein